MDFKDISKVIRQLRDKLGLSQENLAKELGVSFSTVNRWETGKSEPRGRAEEKILELIEKADIDINELSSSISPQRKKIKSKNDVLSTKSMEQMLWDAACSIRGEKDAPKFKDYILPLLFIKRLSDVFEDEIMRLAEKYGEKKLPSHL